MKLAVIGVKRYPIRTTVAASDRMICWLYGHYPLSYRVTLYSQHAIQALLSRCVQEEKMVRREQPNGREESKDGEGGRPRGRGTGAPVCFVFMTFRSSGILPPPTLVCGGGACDTRRDGKKKGGGREGGGGVWRGRGKGRSSS